MPNSYCRLPLSPQYDDDDIGQELREIDDKLRSLEKTARSSSEEQLFFGIAFSLLIVFLTFPTNDLASLLQNFLPLSPDLAIPSATGIKGIGVLFALGASIFRYYGSMCGEHRCKDMRLYSIYSLWMGFNFFILIIGMNIISGIRIWTSLVTNSVGLFVLTAIFFTSFLIEKRMLNFYATKHLVFRSEAIPLVSPFFTMLCAGFFFGLILRVTLLSFLDQSYGGTIQLVLTFAISIGLFLLYAFRGRRRNARKGEAQRKRVFQSKLSRWL